MPANTPPIEELERALEKATPGPWFAHDHHEMDDPDKWIGYAWIGKMAHDPSSANERRWDGVVAKLDRMRDGHEGYRNAAADDARLMVLLRNNADQLLSLAKLGLLVREGGEEVEKAVAWDIRDWLDQCANYNAGESLDRDDRVSLAHAVLRTLEGLVK